MITQLTKEQSAALKAVGSDVLELLDPVTQRTYVLIDSAKHRQVMDALRREEDAKAIAEGLQQMEAGLGKPLDQSFEEMRQELGFAPTKQ